MAWSGTAELVAKYFTKGRMAVTEGRIQTRSWTDKHDQKRKSTEIVVENIYFADSKEKERYTQEPGYGGWPTQDGYGGPAY